MEQFLTDLLRNYGMWAALLWALIETDLIFLVIGAFSAAGYLSLWSCLPAAMFSALMHDTVIFWLAKNRAEWVRSKPAYQKLGPKVETFAKKVGPWSLSICRVLYGTRYPTLIFWGLQRLTYARFWFTDGLGLVLWAALLAWLGHLLGDEMDAIKRVATRTQEVSRWVLMALAGGVALFYCVRSVRRPKQQQEASADKSQKQTENVP
jgi:membrane protein DedA with SNARE-associated domain